MHYCPSHSNTEVKAGHPHGKPQQLHLKIYLVFIPNLLPAFPSLLPPDLIPTPLTLLCALISLSVSSLKTLASNNWKKWLFKDNCNLLNMPGYHMLSALKLQINDEQEQ